MEDFLPSEIARLVLGYLEDEQCKDAYTNFLQSSQHLKECYEFSKKGRKFSTKVMGKTLGNLLEEYCKVCSIVHNQLKKMGRQDDSEPQILNVADQIKWLFESMESTSPTQTMLFRVTLPGSSNRSNRIQSKSVKNDRGKRAIAHVEIDNGNEASDDYANEWSGDDNIDNGNDALDVDTTPLESLPGNEISSSIIKNRRKSVTVHLEKNIDSPEKCLDLLDLNVVQKAFLDNTELHEKIAQNINKVINTPEITILQNELNPNDIDMLNTVPGIDKELNSIIKTIVKETENDPSFEKLINGIVVENQEIISEDSDSRMNSWSESSTPQRPSSIPRDQTHQRRRVQNTIRSLPDLRKGQKRNEILLKTRSRYLKRSATDLRKQFDTLSKIDDQNAEAVQSIIQVTQNTTNDQPHTNKIQSEHIIVKENRKVISMEGTIEDAPISISYPNLTVEQNQSSITTLSPSKCILTSSTNAPISSVQDYIVVTSNSADTLTVPSSTNSIPTESNYLTVQSNNDQTMQQPTYIIGQENASASTTNVTPNIILVQPQYPQISTSCSTISPAQSFTINASNQDIMQMPIVMYTDPVNSSTNNVALPSAQTQFTNPVGSKKYRPILPNYSSQSIITVQPYYEPVPIITEQVPIYVEPSTLTISQNLVQTVSPLNVTTSQTSNVILETTKDTTAPAVVVQSVENTGGQVDTEQEMNQIKEDPMPGVTPTETIKSNRLSLSTPRSGRSHIRALDFSTPLKSSNQRKALTSPKTKTQNRSNDVKEGARMSLFKCEDHLEPIPESASLFGRDDVDETSNTLKTIGIATRTPTQQPTEDWDEVDLIFQPTSCKSVEKSKRSRSFSESDASPVKIEIVKKKPANPGSWDADIRSLVSAVEIVPKKSTITINRKRVRKRPKLNTSSSPKRKITPDKKESNSSQSITPETQPETKPEKIENKRITRSSKKDITTDSILPPKRKNLKKRNDKIQNAETVPTTTSTVVPEPLPSTSNDFWINKNQPTKYKQKCNPTDVVLDKVNEPIIIEPVDNTLCIRNPIEIVSKITPLYGTQPKSTPITVNRNIQSYLETPVKEDFSGIPITPRIMSPTSIAETPITKLLNEQTETIDVSLMPTPGGLSLTPLLAITPKLHDYSSPISYRSRATDYSSCSSYYVPTEDQHTELESLILSDANYEKIKEDTIKLNKEMENVIVEITVDNVVEIPVTTPAKRNDENKSISSDSSSSSSNTSSSNSSCSSCSNDSTSKSDNENNTVIDNSSTNKATNTVEPFIAKTTLVENEIKISKMSEEHVRLNTELNEKRLRTINKFKQDATVSKSSKKSKSANAKKPPVSRKPKTPKLVPFTSRKPKATLASLLKSRRPRSKTNSRQKNVKNQRSSDKEDFPPLHVSSDEEKGDETTENISKPSTSNDQFVQESDTESTIALVTHLKERGILLMPNKKNKNLETKAKNTKLDEEANKSIENTTTPVQEKLNESHEETCKELIETKDKIVPTDSKIVENLQNSDSEDYVEFDNCCLEKEIEIIYDEEKSLNSTGDSSSTTLNTSFAKYEIEYVIDDVTRIFHVSPFFDVLSMPPKRSTPRKKRVVQRVASTHTLNPDKNTDNKLSKSKELTIRTSSPKIKSSSRYQTKSSRTKIENNVDTLLRGCSPIPKEKPIKLKISKTSNGCNEYKSTEVCTTDQTNKKSNSDKKIAVSSAISSSNSIEAGNQTNEKGNSDKKEISSGNSEDLKSNKQEEIPSSDCIEAEIKSKKSNWDKNEDVSSSTLINPSDSDKIRKKISNKKLKDLEDGECSNSEDENLKSCTSSGPSDDKKSKIARATESSTRKRKASSDTPISSSTENSKSNKKIKQNNPQKLLLNLDVDKFLTKVHGPNK